MCDLSVIFPVYNKQNSIQAVYNVTREAIRDNIRTDNYELIFVDDASTDRSAEILSVLKDNDKRVTVVSLVENVGQLKALECGFHMARGKVIVFASCDLQNPMNVLGELYRAIKDGHDLVIPFRNTRPESGIKASLSKVFFFVVRLFFRKIPPGGFDYAAFSEPIHRHLRTCPFDRIVVQMELLKVARNIHYIPIERVNDELDGSNWSIIDKFRYALRFRLYMGQADHLRVGIALVSVLTLISLLIWSL